MPKGDTFFECSLRHAARTVPVFFAHCVFPREKTTHGNRWLKRALSQAAWAASRTKNTYLNAQYHRIARRRGRKRAVVALSHTLLTIIYQLLDQQAPYCELGPEFVNAIDPKSRLRYHTKQIEKLGFKVNLEDPEMAA